MSLPRWLTPAIALTAALSTAGLHLLTRSGLSEQTDLQQPDIYIDQADWHLFDLQGRLAKQLQATRVEQWPDEEGARLIQPRLHIRDRQQRSWQIEAEKGWIHPDEGPFLLEQAVVLHQEGTASGLNARTERLQISRAGDFLQTDNAVVLDSGNWHFTGVGLRADLGRQRIELLNRVQGIHD